MYYVYLLISTKDNNQYIGFTEDIDKRLKEHNAGKVVSTKNRRPLKLIYFEAYLDKRDAQGREQFLKSGAGKRFLRKQLKHHLETSNRGVEQPGSSQGSKWTQSSKPTLRSQL
ncbi:MAG: GIY-YIG nuclease family protein [Candidatus Omnitrophota bacterium]|nr:MAG: GIY-YIG nuclease family protein [Candidatus Omnitrophota bacterium]